jgi:nitroimidazol reductase NimA-like FMN-containing flavoprotein (pyridoxamine 5'-phosphate oxidase superfamily)
MVLDHGSTGLSRNMCLELLASESVGRVGVSVDALPAIFPVRIAFLDGSVVFRTVPGTKFSNAVRHAVLALEVDGFDADGTEGWSVLVRGLASEITDPDEVARARSIMAHAWADADPAEQFVRVSPEVVSGRRLVVASDDPG